MALLVTGVRRNRSVDTGSVPDRDRDDDQGVVANLHDHAVVTDPVPPVPGELARQSFAASAWVFESDWSAGDANASALALLSGPDRPTAVLAASDEMALGVLGAAHQLGLEVPRDLSIVGIDDHDLAAVLGLTTVRQAVAAQGLAAAQTLLGLLGLVTPEMMPEQTFPVELVVRTSTGRPGH